MRRPSIFWCVSFVLVASIMAAPTVSALTAEELLAELPAQDSESAAQLFASVADDADLIRELCGRVVLWEAVTDARVTLALSGLAHHVMRPDNMSRQGALARLYEAALAEAASPEIQRFFMGLLRICGDEQTLEALRSRCCDPVMFDDAIQTAEAVGGAAAIALIDSLACADMPEAFAIAKTTALMRMRGTVVADTDATGLAPVVLAAASAPPSEESRGQVADLCRAALQDASLAPHAQVAALRALVNAAESAALPDLLQAAQSEAPLVWGAALELAARIPGEDATRAWVKALKQLPEAVQPQVVFMLGGRDDQPARSAVIKALGAETESVRLAACETIGRHGGKDALSALERAMRKAEAGAEIQAIKKAMLQFPEPGLSEIAARRIGRGDKTQRIAYLDIISLRRADQHLDEVRRVLRDTEPQVRRAAFNTLAAIGTEEDMPVLLNGVLAEEASAESDAARSALIATADRCGIRASALARVEEAFSGAGQDGRARLLKTFSAFGDKAAFEAVARFAEAALFGESADAALGIAILETLGTWPDRRSCDLLLDLLERLENEEMRLVALKQLLVALPRSFKEPERQLPLLEKAQPLCRTEAEQQIVAEAIAKATPEAKE